VRDFLASVPVVSSGAGAPGSTPASQFELYYDTTNKNWYVAAGISAATDWHLAADGHAAPVTKTGDFTVAAAESFLINNKSGSTCTVTLPSASAFSGREITIKTIQAQTTVSASSNVVPLAGGAAGTAILAGTAGKWATLVSNGTNWEIMASN
jgi:3-dehydroquinate synthase class II